MCSTAPRSDPAGAVLAALATVWAPAPRSAHEAAGGREHRSRARHAEVAQQLTPRQEPSLKIVR